MDFSAAALDIGRERAFAEGVTDLITRSVADVTTCAPARGSLDLVLAAFLHLPEPNLEGTIARTALGLAPAGCSCTSATTRPTRGKAPPEPVTRPCCITASVWPAGPDGPDCRLKRPRLGPVPFPVPAAPRWTTSFWPAARPRRHSPRLRHRKRPTRTHHQESKKTLGTRNQWTST